jgi:hypothetical protein
MPKKVIVDCSTGITTEVELTAEEIADMETARVATEAERAEREAAATAKAAAKASANDKLKALGLSDAEIAAF